KTSIPLPVDVVVATEFSATAPTTVKSVSDIDAEDMILDIGPQTAEQFAGIIAQMKTIIWNGPVGVFEFDSCADGTRAVARAVADSSGFSIAGGGETIAAIDKFGVTEDISYISTGGGAFLEFVQGETLPAVEILEQMGSWLKNSVTWKWKTRIHMALISLRQLLDHAAEHNYGVAAFNVNNLEQVRAIMEGANEVNSPVILQASAGARKYAGSNFLRPLLQAAIEEFPHIPIVMHQDHGVSPAVCQRSIQLGFS